MTFRRRYGWITAGALVASAVAGCSGSGAARHPDPGNSGAASPAADTVARLGRFPVAGAAPAGANAVPPQLADRHHIGLVATGATVDAELSATSDIAITALGPRAPGLPDGVVAVWPAVLTIRVTAVRGAIIITPAQFVAIDGRRRVRLSANTRGLRLAAGRTGSMTLTGRFASGPASLAWAPAGHTIAVWDWVNEYD